MKTYQFVSILALNVAVLYMFVLQTGTLWQIGSVCLYAAFILIITQQIKEN